MYILSFTRYGEIFKELYKFNRNTILTDTIEHSINTQNLAYVGDVKGSAGNHISRKLIFTNNNITCDTPAFGAGIGDKGFNLIYSAAANGDKTVVDFSNNRITIPDYKFSMDKIISASNSSTIVNYSNNIINGALTSK
jgi:hypothetical protein